MFYSQSTLFQLISLSIRETKRDLPKYSQPGLTNDSRWIMRLSIILALGKRFTNFGPLYLPPWTNIRWCVSHKGICFLFRSAMIR